MRWPPLWWQRLRYNRLLRRQQRDCAPGTIVEDCGYHPALVLEVDEWDGADLWRLTTKKPFGCSLMHCGLRPMEPAEVREVMELYDREGEKGLMRRHGWTDEQIEEFYRNWRGESEGGGEEPEGSGGTPSDLPR